MKKIWAIVFIGVLFFALFPSQTQAVFEACKGPLVPCGTVVTTGAVTCAEQSCGAGKPFPTAVKGTICDEDKKPFTNEMIDMTVTFISGNVAGKTATINLVITEACAEITPFPDPAPEPNSKFKVGTPPCQFCHFFVLFNNLINFTLKCIVPIIATIMFAVGGFYFLIAGPSPKMVQQAKSILTAAAAGLGIVLVSYIFLNTFLTYMGVATWTGLVGESGIAETGGKTGEKYFIRDTDKKWKDGQWIGKKITITKGPGAVQTKEILNNTSNQIFANFDFINNYPGNGSHYKIGGAWWEIKCP